MKSILTLVAALAMITGSMAQQVYYTNEPQEKLMQLDFATGKQTTLYDIGAEPDDLTLNAQGQLIYSVPSLGTVNLYDPATGTSSVLVGGIKYVRDLLIEPSGTTMLISSYAQGKIMRFSFITGALTVLSKNLHRVDGLAYDPEGQLFAVANSNTVVQIDPVTGAVLKTLVLEPHLNANGGDGMTYDSYTGQLWVSHYGTTSGLIEIPTDLSGFTLYQVGKMPYPDGIKSDGKGNLFIGAAWRADMYNIPSDQIVKSYVVRGADGIAIVPGAD
jgi:streptogramin lyase